MQQTASEPAREQLEALRASALDARLGNARILVLEADSGRRLIQRAAERPAETASVMKTITSAAALHVLGADHRVQTRVVQGSAPGEIVLVGGGDVTLSRVPGDGETFYPSPARLDELARRTLKALGGTPPTKVTLDSSLFPDDGWHEDWDPAGRDPEGYMPIIAALEVDGDRNDPATDDSARGADPVQRAGEAFASLLGGAPELLRGTAPVDAKLLASVESPPVEALVRETLRSSDNALAEALARLTAHAAGETPDFAGGARAQLAQLQAIGVPTESVRLVDGSGLSHRIQIPAATIADLLRRARLREGVLGELDDRLTRTGPVKTMAESRFVGKNAIVGDAVRGKTGYIGSVHSLAGIVRTRGGTDLVFAVFAMGDRMPPGADAKAAVDDFVTELHLQGDALLSREEPMNLDD